MPTRTLVLVIVAVLGQGHLTAQTPPADVSPVEGTILMELLAATGGFRWNERGGWGTSASVCDWHDISKVPLTKPSDRFTISR